MAIPYVHEDNVAYGRAEPKSPLITRVTAENPGPFTYWGTGTFIIGAGGAAAIIDPGPLDRAHVRALTEALGNTPVSHILVTHTHLDHSPASAELQAATGARICAFGPHGSGRAGGLEHEEVEAGADKDFTPDRRLADGDIIEGEGWTIEAMHTPGHTSNHLCFALKEENVLFSGDHVMGWSTTIVSPPDGDMVQYMASTKTIRGRGFDALYPTHGPAITAPETFLEALIDHRLSREERILAAVYQGHSTVPDIVTAVYTDVPDHLHPAAARSTLSHLIKLVDEGRVAAAGGARLDARFGTK